MTLPGLADLERAAGIVYRHMAPTPQFQWPLLNELLGTQAWVKHENYTPLGAFKLRGGLVYMDWLRRKGGCAGVIAATRGNHGQSVAFAAGLAGLPSVIVVPHGNSREKNRAMQALGAELIVHGQDFQSAREFASALAEDRQLHMVPSFHPLLVAGVGTYALEFFRAVQALDTVYVPIGLGSGICGVLAVREALGLDIDVVGVVSSLAPAYARSFVERRPVEAAVSTTLGDGMACRVPEVAALELIWSGVSRIVEVSDVQLAAAMGHLYEATHGVAEGAGAASLAAALQEKNTIQGKQLGLVISGGNVDRDVFSRVLASKESSELVRGEKP